MNRVVFSSLSPHWDTPKAVYDALDAEFHFADDPCPAGGMFGLDREWKSPAFVNPPYSQIGEWMEKGIAEWKEGKRIVFLIPARTDARWFHNHVLPNASEIRFIKGRLKFNGSKTNAPFPSMVVVFEGARP